MALVLLTDRTGFVSNISYFGAMADRGGMESGLLRVLWSGKTLPSSTFFTFGLYPRVQIPHYPSNKRQGGPQSWSDRFGEKNLLTPPGIYPRVVGFIARSPVTVPAMEGNLVIAYKIMWAG